jgi:hypothetical protein
MRFEAARASALRLRNSVAPELLLIAFVYGIGVLIIWRQYLALDTATWYAAPTAAGSKLTLAGIWYGYVSLPIFQFLLVRWYFRLLIWARFLWQVSRIELSLIPTHPDRVGGLEFLATSAGDCAYGTLAERYVREFDGKWLRGRAPVDEPFVGSGDIQSLADLGNSYELVRAMRIVPITRDALILLAASTLVPIVPLILTMMPLEELLKKLLGVLF